MLSLSDQVLMTEGAQFSWCILPPNLYNAFELHVKAELNKVETEQRKKYHFERNVIKAVNKFQLCNKV